MSYQTLSKTPVFFVSHGGPSLLEDVAKPGDFFSWLGNYLKKELKPKAIVIISAHWQGKGEKGVFVDTSEKPKLIYDFGGFPQRYFEHTWDHKGSPAIAGRVIDLLNEAGFQSSGKEYGNDHGTWVPLKRAMTSNPDIPIVEVSTFSHEDMEMHTKMGQALAPLREEGVVIIGSGSAVHNLYQLSNYWNKPSPKFVLDFDSEMTNIATNFTGKERNDLANKIDKHPDFRMCHPTAEHLVPYHVAIGAAGADEGKTLLDGCHSTFSWNSFAFGLPNDTELPKYDGSQTRDE